MENQTQTIVAPPLEDQISKKNQIIIWLSAGILVSLSIMGLMGYTYAKQDDYIRKGLEDNLAISANLKEKSYALAQSSFRDYIEKSIKACEDQKALAQWKVAENVEPERKGELQDIVYTDCTTSINLQI